jgi:hypothetical protein
MSDFPVINGRHFSFASAEIKLDGVSYTGITSINWKEELKPTKVQGTGVYPLGETKGEYSCEADLEMHLQTANALRAALAAKDPNGSYALPRFQVLVYFSEGGEDPVHEVKLQNCRFSSADNSNSQGADASMEKIGLYVRHIERDGLRMLAFADAGLR